MPRGQDRRNMQINEGAIILATVPAPRFPVAGHELFSPATNAWCSTVAIASRNAASTAGRSSTSCASMARARTGRPCCM